MIINMIYDERLPIYLPLSFFYKRSKTVGFIFDSGAANHMCETPDIPHMCVTLNHVNVNCNLQMLQYATRDLSTFSVK